MDTPAPLIDVTLLATLGIILVATMVGAYLRSTRRDPCLDSFDGFHVTLELDDGRLIWGEMELASTGLELRYRSAVHDAGHLESSYVLYGDEFKNIQAIYRYAEEMDPDVLRRRDRDIAAAFNPGPLRQVRRDLHHFVTTAGDSLNDTLGVVLGRLRSSRGRYITAEGEAELKELGAGVIGQVGYAYDPLLERFIGQKVVFELVEKDEDGKDDVHEIVGIFKNYSPDFLEFLNVHMPVRRAIELNPDGTLCTDWVAAVTDGEKLRVTNSGSQPIMIDMLVGEEGQEHPVNAVVERGETAELYPPAGLGRMRLQLRVVRELDMVVPRTRALVRHRVESYAPELLPQIIFDLGVALRRRDKLHASEERLRAHLRDNPDSPLAHVNLAALLMRREAYAEAEALLSRALSSPYALPDNGRRAGQLLQEARQKRQQAQPPAAATPPVSSSPSPAPKPPAASPRVH